MIAHIDLDILVYSVGAACDGKRYVIGKESFQYKKDALAYAKSIYFDPAGIEATYNPEPWSKVQRSVNIFLEAIIALLGCGYKGYLSGKSNFRYDIATILPYKGNRSSFKKPYHYDAIRQYLVDIYQAEVTKNMEADDLIGLNHDPEEDAIVTRDKDLNTIPGLHLNWSNNACYYTFPVEADRNFYCQLLTGDRTDNIMGLFGVGIDGEHVAAVKKMTSSKEMFDYVAIQYKRRFGNYWIKFMEENANLLWILQKREPTWKRYLEDAKADVCSVV